MQNLFAPFRRVRAKQESRRTFRSLQAKLAIASACGLQVGEGELETQRAVFTSKNHLGSFQQCLAAGLLLPKLHNASRFIAHKSPARYRQESLQNSLQNYVQHIPQNTRRAKCKFSPTSPFGV